MGVAAGVGVGGGSGSSSAVLRSTRLAKLNVPIILVEAD